VNQTAKVVLIAGARIGLQNCPMIWEIVRSRAPWREGGLVGRRRCLIYKPLRCPSGKTRERWVNAAR
jgi:hypothetical protein